MLNVFGLRVLYFMLKCMFGLMGSLIRVHKLLTPLKPTQKSQDRFNEQQCAFIDAKKQTKPKMNQNKNKSRQNVYASSWRDLVGNSAETFEAQKMGD